MLVISTPPEENDICSGLSRGEESCPKSTELPEIDPGRVVRVFVEMIFSRLQRLSICAASLSPVQHGVWGIRRYIHLHTYIGDRANCKPEKAASG